MSGGALDGAVTLEDVLAVVAARRAPLAPELAGYLALDLAEQADGGDLDPLHVLINDDGAVLVVRLRRDQPRGDSESSIRALLARLLEASGSHTPALAAVSKRRGGAGIDGLIEELAAALIPVNRAAGRRALARLAREVKRVTSGAPQRAATSPPVRATAVSLLREEDPTTAPSRVPEELLRHASPDNWAEMPTSEFAPSGRRPSPSEADVDELIAQFGVSGEGEQQHARALRAMAGIEGTPPAPRQTPSRPPASPSSRPPPPLKPPRDSGVEALLALEPPGAEPGDRPPPTDPRSLSPATRPDRPASLRARDAAARDARVDARQLPTQPPPIGRTRITSRPPPPRASRGVGLSIAIGLVMMAAGSYGAWRFHLATRAAAAQRAEVRPAPAPPSEPARSCLGTLVIDGAPERAEILLREGQAPLDIPRMPVGARLEFVATAEGYAPKRVVVPAGGGWDPGPEGRPRFETAVQLEPSRAPADAIDPWPAGEPGSAVGGQGPPGTVHIVASPRGAEVWMLAGIGPQARIEQIRCDQDIDVLIAGPTTYRRRLRVTTADFVTDDAGATPRAHPRIARVAAQ